MYHDDDNFWEEWEEQLRREEEEEEQLKRDEDEEEQLRQQEWYRQSMSEDC